MAGSAAWTALPAVDDSLVRTGGAFARTIGRSRVQPVMHRLALILAACHAQAVTVASPAPAAKLSPRWTVTSPKLPSSIRVATHDDTVYALGCATPAHLVALTAGDVGWTRELEGGCVGIAADADGPIVSVIGAHGGAWGMNVIAFDRAGKVRWQREVRGSPQGGSVATTAGRIAVCFEANGELQFRGGTLGSAQTLTAVAIELDPQGTVIDVHQFARVLDPPTCSYDEQGALWAVVKGANQLVRLGPEERELDRGMWAVRLTGAPALIRLATDDTSQVTTVPAGFVVADAEGGALSLIDPDGSPRWAIDDPTLGCRTPARVVSATPERLVVGISTRCATPRTMFGDVAISGRGPARGSMLVVAMDMTTRRARSVLELPDAPDRTELALVDHGLVAYGELEQRLGLGTAITVPDSYECVQPMPAPDWPGKIDSYPSPTASCRKGYELHIRHGRSPFVAAFVRSPG